MNILDLPLELIVEIFLFCPEYLVLFKYVCSDFLNASKFIIINNKEAIKVLAKRGELKLLKFLKKKGQKFDIDILYAAAEGCQFETLKFLNKEVEVNKWVSVFAAKGGNIEILNWLSKKTKISKKCYYVAALYGQHEILNWLKETKCIYPKSTELLIFDKTLLENACKSKDYETILFVINNFFMENYLPSGSLHEILERNPKFIESLDLLSRYYLRRSKSYMAAKKGDIETLNSLKRKNIISYNHIIEGFGRCINNCIHSHEDVEDKNIVNKSFEVFYWLLKNVHEEKHLNIGGVLAKHGNVFFLETLILKSPLFSLPSSLSPYEDESPLVPLLRVALAYTQYDVVEMLLKKSVMINCIPFETFDTKKHRENYFCPIEYYYSIKEEERRIEKCIELLMEFNYEIGYMDYMNASIQGQKEMIKKLILKNKKERCLFEDVMTFNDEIIEFLLMNYNYQFKEIVCFFLTNLFINIRTTKVFVKVLFKKNFTAIFSRMKSCWLGWLGWLAWLN